MKKVRKGENRTSNYSLQINTTYRYANYVLIDMCTLIISFSARRRKYLFDTNILRELRPKEIAPVPAYKAY